MPFVFPFHFTIFISRKQYQVSGYFPKNQPVVITKASFIFRKFFIKIAGSHVIGRQGILARNWGAFPFKISSAGNQDLLSLTKFNLFQRGFCAILNLAGKS